MSFAAGLLAVSVLTSVPEVFTVPPSVLAERPETVVTGLVTSVFRWQQNCCLLASPEDINGPGVYVSGMMPDRPRATIRGAQQLNRGDRVVVRGQAQSMLLEPGIVADEYEVIGHEELPSPQICRIADIQSGSCNNRRVTVEGVFWGTKILTIGSDEMTVFRLGTSEGPITLRLAGAHPELADLRNACVRAEGVALPMYNARGEFLYAEIEVFSREGIRSVAPAKESPVVDISSTLQGVLAWRPGPANAHLRCVRGEVLFVDEDERFFVVRPKSESSSDREPSIRINMSDDCRSPAVGDWVDCDGFPARLNDFGVLEEGLCRPLEESGTQAEPEAVGDHDLHRLLARTTDLDEDYAYRYVRLRGRIESVSRRSDGTLELHVSTPHGNLLAVLDQADAALDERFIDRPLADLVGVMDTHLSRNATNGRVLSAGEVELRLRSEDDIVIVPDDAARTRRFWRVGRQVVLLLTIPLVLVLAWFLIASWRRRALAAALAQDRRRTAEALHDTVSQQLAGARMMIFSARMREDIAPDVKENLGLAIDVLESARREVRDAVLRLKSDDFALQSAESLIRACAKRASAHGDLRVTTRLCAFPDWVTGEVKTDLLSTIQEAITNAVRHGKAKRVAIIASRLAGNGLVVSVLNDGTPFDASRALGPETGHFGLSGMRERAERCGFALSFCERKGWMEVRLERREK